MNFFGSLFSPFGLMTQWSFCPTYNLFAQILGKNNEFAMTVATMSL